MSASRSYAWAKATPEAMTQRRGCEPSPRNARGRKASSPAIRSIFSLSCRWRSGRNCGVAIHRPGSFSKRGGRFKTSGRPQGTFWRAWHTRVVGRSMTGISYFSESAKACCTMSLASAGLAGSKTGILAKSAKKRLSCSVCELWGPGSSAATRTNPPFVPR